jgi:ABC-type iron transport system FetAB permease component
VLPNTYWPQIVIILAGIVLTAVSILLIIFNKQIVKAIEPTGQKIKAYVRLSSIFAEHDASPWP